MTIEQLSPSAALVVVDVQNGFNHPEWGARNNPDAETNVGILLAEWRRTGRPIHHIHHHSKTPEGKFWPGTFGSTVKVEALPIKREPIHVKQVNSAFIGTSLERDLRDAGIDTVIVVGLTTNHCVSTTVRMAANLGFKTFIVRDATATFERAGIDGDVRPAAEVHASALSDLSGEFATVVRTAEVITAAVI
ncbi:MAG: cysteine hydrolase family protein [Pseudomonadota bacterium]